MFICEVYRVDTTSCRQSITLAFKEHILFNNIPDNYETACGTVYDFITETVTSDTHYNYVIAEVGKVSQDFYDRHTELHLVNQVSRLACLVQSKILDLK